MDQLLKLVESKKVKTYDLSQPLGTNTPFWPYYPPFEVKYFKRKSEHGVNAQYIQTSLHIGTHLDERVHINVVIEGLRQILNSFRHREKELIHHLIFSNLILTNIGFY
ncbi:MAG: cyclase family protein [Methanobacteriota archaeon]